MTDRKDDRQAKLRSNERLAALCVAVVVGMVGLAYAAVPLYQIFCQVTGYGGTPQRAEAAPEGSNSNAMVKVRFDSNVAPGLPWTFEPVEREIKVALGEQKLTYYRAVNNSDKPVTGMATFNVTPVQAGYHFNKIDCFCFTEQTLAPGQAVDMPVLFFVDEELSTDKNTAHVHTLTLSYTFYEKDTPATSAAADIKNTGRDRATPASEGTTQRGGALNDRAPENTGAEGHG